MSGQTWQHWIPEPELTDSTVLKFPVRLDERICLTYNIYRFWGRHPSKKQQEHTARGMIPIEKNIIVVEDSLVKENYCLWRLMIDKRYQGQGFGKKTIDAVMNLIRTFPFGEAKKVWLSYEPENLRARTIPKVWFCGERRNVWQ